MFNRNCSDTSQQHFPAIHYQEGEGAGSRAASSVREATSPPRPCRGLYRWKGHKTEVFPFGVSIEMQASRWSTSGWAWPTLSIFPWVLFGTAQLLRMMLGVDGMSFQFLFCPFTVPRRRGAQWSPAAEGRKN